MSGAREQVIRLLALTPYLRARHGVPLGQVAADFGVPPAQIVKDLKVLWMCGLPGFGPDDLVDIDFEAFEADPDGLVRIDNAEFLPRPLRLTGVEAAALVVALRALREGSSRESREVIDRVLAKLAEAAGEAGQVPAEVHLPRRPARTEEVRAVLDEALRADRQVELEYYVPARDESTRRVVDPLALLEHDGHDYLDAWCHRAEDRRLFRLDRIDAAQRVDTARQAPPVAPRDLAEGLFERGPDDQTATLRLRPAARWVADYYPVTGQSEGPDGSLDVTLAVGDPRWLVRLVLSLAPEVTVRSPASYDDEVRSVAVATLALYEDGVT
ncbi:MAG: helix-turn-helix transcriptional regulator [Marmoricola sp.]